ncbi:MAG: nicotinate phosphoribosyltransferase, partial [Burkholderiaceae bacterium]
FGLRRAHGADAGLMAARASYLAGFAGTATMLAERLFGIPTFGTMAHSYIEAFDDEAAAFESFARARPQNLTFLIDTYDTEAAAQQVVRLAQWLQEEENIHIKAVRIDSGDLDIQSRRVRQILDEGDCHDIGIFVSGNLDEYAVQSLLENGAPIDGFGVGTKMNTSSDAPYLDCAYKLVEYAGQPCRKRSSGKATWPACKQVFRHYDTHGVMSGDTLTLQHDALAGEPLLQPAIRGSMLLTPSPSLLEMRAYAAAQIASLPPSLRTLTTASPYRVAVSDALKDLTQRVDARQHSLADADFARWGNNAG